MLEWFKLRPISSFLFVAALSLSSCGQNLVDKPVDDQSLIGLRISQGTHVETVFEDLAFRDLLNTPDAVDEDNVPAPEAWHKIDYDKDQVMSMHVNNCSELDLLEFIIYDEFDSQGRPKDYRYFTVCGVEADIDCGAPMGLSAEALHDLSDPNIEKFAFSGICISEDEVDAKSFIIFLEKG